MIYESTIFCTYFNVRNTLPNHVVDVNTVKLFKARLDRFWENRDVKIRFHGQPNRN